MCKILCSSVIIPIFAILTFCSCNTCVDPVAIEIEYADIQALGSSPPDKTDYLRQDRENCIKAKEYREQGVLKMNSTDTNELKLSRRLFYASLSLNDQSSETWSYLGDVSVKQNQLGKSDEEMKNAIFCYTKAIDLDKKNGQFYYKRGNCYFAMSDSAYLSDYRKSCDLGNKEACSRLK